MLFSLNSATSAFRVRITFASSGVSCTRACDNRCRFRRSTDDNGFLGVVVEVVGEVAGDLDAVGDFVGDLAGIFSAMSRTGAAADRFVGVRGVDFACGGVATAVLVLDFGVAPFTVELC